MTVREFRHEDLDQLCALAMRFVDETELPLTYSEEHTRRTLWAAMHDDDCILLVWEANDVLAGAVLGLVESDFYNELCAYVTKFYVEREFRGLSVSKDLLKAFDVTAAEKGASVIFASATAGMSEGIEKLYVRLFERQGYNVLGRVLVKECA